MNNENDTQTCKGKKENMFGTQNSKSNTNCHLVIEIFHQSQIKSH